MMEIIIPDMGHGNCIGMFDEGLSPLLLDCGTKSNSKINNFTNLIEQRLKKTNKSDLIITHYHFDHYSLLGNFPRKFFDDVYLPALPKKSTTAQVMEKFLALAIATRYEKYYLTPMILSSGKQIHCLVKNQTFDVIGRNWEVLWPDYRIIDRINRRKIKTIFDKIEEVRGKLNERQSQEFEKWYTYLSENFTEEPKDMDQNSFSQETPMGEEVDEELTDALISVERIFRDIANRASLVVRDESFDFLFTGDIDDIILNKHLDFGNHDHFLIEAPHHGGYYGYAFDNVSTKVLVISREVNYRPDCRFFRNLPWSIIVDTARTGNSIIQSMGSARGVIVYPSHTRPFYVYFV